MSKEENLDVESFCVERKHLPCNYRGVELGSSCKNGAKQ